jgi:hypothetical protein
LAAWKVPGAQNMKKPFLCQCGVLMLAGVLPAFGDSLVNGSFESGNFHGWTLENPRGLSVFQPRRRAAGTANVMSSWIGHAGLPSARQATEGRGFAGLGSLMDGHFTGNWSYNITLKQTLSLAAGDQVSGWSFFYNGDYEPQDSAWVTILDSSGQEVGNPWGESSGGLRGFDGNSTACFSATPWTFWNWEAPADGLYTVTLGLTTGGDNSFASYGFFDDIRVQTSAFSPVPEPSALALLASGALLLIHLRRPGNRG